MIVSDDAARSKYAGARAPSGYNLLARLARYSWRMKEL
jgi:hypothetical protein